MSLNKVFNADVPKNIKLQSHFYSAKLQTILEFDDDKNFEQNGVIQTDTSRANRNDLYYTNEQKIQFPLNNAFQRFYQQLAPDVTIQNNDGERTIFDTTGSIGSLEILPDVTRIGSEYKATAHGSIITSSGNQQIRIKTYLGTAEVESATFTLPNLPSGSFWDMDMRLLVYQIGNAGTAIIKTFGKFQFINQQGLTNTFFMDDTNNTTYQTTTLATANITIEWLTISGGNIIKVHTASVYMLN